MKKMNKPAFDEHKEDAKRENKLFTMTNYLMNQRKNHEDKGGVPFSNVPYAMMGMSKEEARKKLAMATLLDTKERIKEQDKFLEEFKDDFVEFRSKKGTDLFFHSFPTRPGWNIQLDFETVKKVSEIWSCPMELLNMGEPAPGEEWFVPTDILWNKTVPLNDVYLDIGMIDAIGRSAIKGARIIIKKQLDDIDFVQLESENQMVIGYVTIHLASDNATIGTELILDKSDPDSFFYNDNYVLRGTLKNGALVLKPALDRVMTWYMAVWYSVQISYLHPIIKECVVNTPPKPREVKNHKPQKYQKPISNCKHVRLDGKTLEKVLYSKGTGGKYHRHKQLWRVRGYHRSNGTFVEPHFKGPLTHVDGMNYTRLAEYLDKPRDGVLKVEDK